MPTSDGSSTAKRAEPKPRQEAEWSRPIGSPGAERVVAAARGLLQQSPYQVLRRVRCEFHEGILTLRGEVPSFYMKQIAQTTVRRVLGVEVLVNRLEVPQ